MISVSSSEAQDVLIDLDGAGSDDPLALLESGGEADPMGNVANLVDVMLVLACGLMLAIVTFWQIDLPNVTEVLKQKEMTEISDIEDLSDRTKQAGSSYDELGVVYSDPETGKMYLIQDDEEGDAGEGNGG